MGTTQQQPRVFDAQDAERFAALVAGADTGNPSEPEAMGKFRFLRRMLAERKLRLVDALELPEIRQALDDQMQPIRQAVPAVAALQAENEDLRGKLAVAVPKVRELAEAIKKEREKTVVVRVVVLGFVLFAGIDIVVERSHRKSIEQQQATHQVEGVRVMPGVRPSILAPYVGKKLVKKSVATAVAATPRYAAPPDPESLRAFRPPSSVPVAPTQSAPAPEALIISVSPSDPQAFTEASPPREGPGGGLVGWQRLFRAGKKREGDRGHAHAVPPLPESRF
jgi:hypothetical protein